MGVHAEFGEFSLRAEEHITRARHMMAICGRAGRWEWALFFFDRAMKYGASVLLSGDRWLQLATSIITRVPLARV